MMQLENDFITYTKTLEENILYYGQSRDGYIDLVKTIRGLMSTRQAVMAFIDEDPEELGSYYYRLKRTTELLEEAKRQVQHSLSGIEPAPVAKEAIKEILFQLLGQDLYVDIDESILRYAEINDN